MQGIIWDSLPRADVREDELHKWFGPNFWEQTCGAVLGIAFVVVFIYLLISAYNG